MKTLTLQDPKKVSKPKYEATALQARPSTISIVNDMLHMFVCISPDLDGSTNATPRMMRARLTWMFARLTHLPTAASEEAALIYGLQCSFSG